MSLQELATQVKNLKDEITRLKMESVESKEQPLASVAGSYNSPQLALVVRKKLIGHFGKIYSCAWAPDSNRVLSACQDGRLIVWNARNGYKNHVVTLASAWVMSCGYHTDGGMVASGGLDNICSLYRLGDDVKITEAEELTGHDGYISSINFIDNNRVLTTSGDSTAILWDINSHRRLSTLEGHSMDIMSASYAEDGNTVVTASVDFTTCLWDLRTPEDPIKTFIGHEMDVNDVKMFRDGSAFVSGSDDGTCRLFDIRAYAQLNEYRTNVGVASVDLSSSNRFIVAALDDADSTARVYDTVTTEEVCVMGGHERRIGMARVAPSGIAIMTASWDSTMQLFASSN